MKTLFLLLVVLSVACSPLLAQNVSSIHFDGVDDEVNIGTNPIFQIANNLTLEAWVKIDSNQQTNYGRIIDKYNHVTKQGYNLIIHGNRLFMEFFSPDSATHNIFQVGTINDNIWHHVAGTFSTDTLKLYIDGVLNNAVGSGPQTIAPCSNDLGIGANWDGAAFLPVHGYIDEVRIWNVLRTAYQINAYKDSCLGGFEPGLVGLWRFNENTDTIAHDATPNGNNGALWSGAAWSTDIQFQQLGDCIFTGVEPIKNENSISVFPNPVENHSIVSMKAVNSEWTTMQVYDCLGRLDMERTNDGYGAPVISKQDFKAGIYFLVVITASGKKMNARFVVD